MNVRTTEEQQSRIAEITELASGIAELYWEGDRVDPKRVLKAKGVRVCEGDFGDAFDGLLEWRAGRFYVYCNVADRLAERIRFTLGHETGHFFIDEHRNALVVGSVPSHPCECDFTSDSPIEREADAFSAYLLMPPNRFEKAARRAPKGLSGIVKLANLFGTSITATALRYLDDVLHEGLLICWDSEGFRWRRVSQEWWFESKQKRRTIRSAGNLVPDCATDRLIRGESPDGDGIFRAGSIASAWFPSIGIHQYSNDILQEEAMQIGKYGFLTLLYPA